MKSIKGFIPKTRLFLAPMAGVNCIGLRMLSEELGAGLVYTQMYHTDFLLEKKNISSEFNSLEKNVAVQLLGNNPEKIKTAIQVVESSFPSVKLIDLNMGCSERNITDQTLGCSLMKESPEKLVKIFSTMVGATNLPVTVKIRSGWDNQSINAVQVAKLAESCGINAIGIHARTQKQKYTGKADWTMIKAVKDSVSIPVVGNGDIRKPNDAAKMFQTTGCDYAMIGRAARSNPFLFYECKQFFDKGTYDEITDPLRLEYIQKFISYYFKYESRTRASELKHHLIWMIAGLKNAKDHKRMLSTFNTNDEIINYINDIKLD